MTPLELDILMTYATTGNDFREMEREGVITQTIEQFIMDDILEFTDRVEPGDASFSYSHPMDHGPKYRITEKGQVWMDEIMVKISQVPLPIQEWVMPKNLGPPAPPDSELFTDLFDVTFVSRGLNCIKMLIKHKEPGGKQK